MDDLTKNTINLETKRGSSNNSYGNNKRMKHFWASKILYIFFCGFMFSCTNTKQHNDYSAILKETVFSGAIKDRSSTFYLIRKDSDKMSGICFVDKGDAIVDVIQFSTDPTGSTSFQVDGKHFTGKLEIIDAEELMISIPDIQTLGVVSQQIKLSKKNNVTNLQACQERYKEKIFKDITSTKNIQYGEATGYYTSKPIDYIKNEDYVSIFREMSKSYKESVIEQGMSDLPLYMDIYHPKNDIINKRPLLLFIHGGSFFFGDKENLLQQTLMEEFVRKGYVVASINYRLCSTLLGYPAIERAIYRGVQDARASLRHIIAHKDKYGIDEEQIYTQ